MLSVPPYAQALLQRRSGPSSPLARSLQSPVKSSMFQDDIADLESQISELTVANQEIPMLRQQLEAEKETTTHLGREYDFLTAALAEEEEKCQAVTDQVSQIRSLIESKQSIIDAKSATIDTLQGEYAQLQGEYRHALDVFQNQTGEIRRQRPSPSPRRVDNMYGSPTQQRYNGSPSQQRFDDFEPTRPRGFRSPRFDDFGAQDPPRFDDFDASQRGFRSPDPPRYDDFEPPPQRRFDDFAQSYDGVGAMGSPRGRVDAFEPPVGADRSPRYDFGVHDEDQRPWLSSPMELRMFTRPVVSSPVHAALKDNISFGDDESAPAHEDELMNTMSMSISEMHASLRGLQNQKEQMEAMLSRSPPRNMSLAEAKREKMQTQEQLEFVVQNINKIRLELKQCHQL